MKKLITLILTGMLVLTGIPSISEAADLSQCSGADISEEKSENTSGVSTDTSEASADTSEASADISEESTEMSSSESNVVNQDETTDSNDPSVIESTESSTYLASANAVAVPKVSYQAHVQNIGWKGEVSDGAVAGTTGQSFQVEALKIKVSGDSSLGVVYQAHVQNIGWQDEVADGAIAGTTGQSLRIEALRINLFGADASKYDIYYCTHIEDYGWLNWTKNGAMSGSKGVSKRVEALEIKILPKGSSAPSTLGRNESSVNDDGIILSGNRDKVTYSSISNGASTFSSAVADGKQSGTTGKSKALEQIKISDSNNDISVSYSVHVADIGWTDYVGEGEAAGVKGKSIQALKIKLSGSDASKYDVYYCVHSQDYGWFNWVKDDEVAGTTGFGYRAEAFAVKIVPKKSTAPAKLGSLSIGSAESTTTLSYSAHVQDIGWMDYVSNGATAGTTGRSLRVEALKIKKSGTSISGSVSYKAHVQDIGWMKSVSDDAIAGTTGQSKRVEAVSISLTGGLAEAFNVYYRTHVQDVGWTGWASNGANCGSQGYGRRVEAIQIKLVAKGMAAPGSTTNTFLKKTNKVIVLDPGHGGTDGGAGGFGQKEGILTLKISNYCKAELETYKNVDVYMTRNSDVYVGLEQRAAIAQSYGADLFVAIHLNASENHASHGAEVWYPNSSYNTNAYTVGKGAASSIENQLAGLGLYKRGIYSRNSANGTTYPDGSIADYYSVIRNGKLRGVPAIITESCFIDNSSDYHNYLSSEAKLQAIGKSIATGIARYYGLGKK